MDNIETFTTVCGMFQFTVKSEFFSQEGVTRESSVYDLLHNYKMPKYFHNPHGPAMKHLRSGYREFYLNGTRCDPETEKKIIHNEDFKGKFTDILENGA